MHVCEFYHIMHREREREGDRGREREGERGRERERFF